MLHLMHLVGARPQFIKAAALSQAIYTHFSTQIKESLVHSGQHYDYRMSGLFFEELGLPKPVFNCAVGSGSHAQQTGNTMVQLEQYMQESKPHVLLVYGDTNTTLAGALVASKLHIPVVHVEAGLRSFNRQMPEELNRIITDRLSERLYTITPHSMNCLRTEGLDQQALVVGDVMYDAALSFADKAKDQALVIEGEFALVTLHRAENVDQPERLKGYLSALDQLAKQQELRLLFPMHPRVKAELDAQGIDLKVYSSFVVEEPLSYLSTLKHISAAQWVATDSGGLQKEAFFAQKPVCILRSETEWVEMVESNSACLLSPNFNVEDTQRWLNKHTVTDPTPWFGQGNAAQTILMDLLKQFKPS